VAAKGKESGVRALYERIYKVAKAIPRGRIATYGQVAELAGIPGGARVAGAAMRALKEGGKVGRVPWHRVVGKASPRTARVSILDPVGGAIQRQRLEDEGVVFSARGTISLVDYGWLPTRE